MEFDATRKVQERLLEVSGQLTIGAIAADVGSEQQGRAVALLLETARQVEAFDEVLTAFSAYGPACLLRVPLQTAARLPKSGGGPIT